MQRTDPSNRKGWPCGKISRGDLRVVDSIPDRDKQINETYGDRKKWYYIISWIQL